MSVQSDVRPDFIRDDDTVICFVDLHCFFNLPAFPDTATWIVRAAENCHMDVVCLKLCIHICIVHAPDTIFILYERAVDDFKTVVRKAAGKADIGRAVQQNSIARCSERRDCGDDASQHTIFIADAFPCQTGDMVSCFLPADDGRKVGVRQGKIAESRVLYPLNDRLLYGRNRWKIHICDPHRNRIKALLWCSGSHPLAGTNGVYCNRILAVPVQDAGKIVFHDRPPVCK